jgi:hypothetical protein
MMRHFLPMACLLGLLAGGTASAETREIPLAGLLGVYDGTTFNRYSAIELVPPPEIVRGVWFRLRGTATVDTLTCDAAGLPPTILLIIPFELNVSEAPLYWSAAGLMPTASGPFEWTEPFSGPAGVTNHWEFLHDGKAEFRLHGYGGDFVPGCTSLGSPPTAIVEEAVLIVDADYPVPALPASWGRLKALYR